MKKREIPFRLSLAVVLAVCAPAATCRTTSAGPPQIVLDRSACDRCGMLISEITYAAAYQVGTAAPKCFDDIGCLLHALQNDSGADEARVWVHDLVSRQWIDGKAAFFVTSSGLATPMGSGIIAFLNQEPASKYAQEQGGSVKRSLSALLREYVGGGGR